MTVVVVSVFPMETTTENVSPASMASLAENETKFPPNLFWAAVYVTEPSEATATAPWLPSLAPSVSASFFCVKTPET